MILAHEAHKESVLQKWQKKNQDEALVPHA